MISEDGRKVNPRTILRDHPVKVLRPSETEITLATYVPRVLIKKCNYFNQIADLTGKETTKLLLLFCNG